MFLVTLPLDTTQQGSLHMYQGFCWSMFLMNSLLRNAKYIIVRNERRILILLADKVILGFRNIKKCQVFSKKHKRLGLWPLFKARKNRCTGYAIHKVLGLSSEIRESCPLHILPPMPTSSHWWDWKKPQKSFQRTSGSIRNKTPGFPVAQHFNSTGQSISGVQVRGVALCSGINVQRK